MSTPTEGIVAFTPVVPEQYKVLQYVWALYCVWVCAHTYGQKLGWNDLSPRYAYSTWPYLGQDELKEASTHKSAESLAGTFFMPCELWPFDP